MALRQGSARAARPVGLAPGRPEVSGRRPRARRPPLGTPPSPPLSKYRDDKNTVYAASTKLELGGDDDGREIAGWGVFPRFDRRLVLTDPNGAGVSNWRLPRWFYPDGQQAALDLPP